MQSSKTDILNYLDKQGATGGTLAMIAQELEGISRKPVTPNQAVLDELEALLLTMLKAQEIASEGDKFYSLNAPEQVED